MKLLAQYKPEHPVAPAFDVAGKMAVMKANGVSAADAEARLNAAISARNRAIELSEEDPFLYRYEPPVWKLADVLVGLVGWDDFEEDPRVPAAWKTDDLRRCVAERPCRRLLILGGNRASKTTYLLDRVVRSLERFPGSSSWVYHEDNTASVRVHQAGAYEYMPAAWREVKKGKVANLTWTLKNGFANDSFATPGGAVCEFRNYMQAIKSVEGANLGSPGREPAVGLACDELCPMDWWDTLCFRTATRRAIAMLGFTPIEGYTATVARFLDGARTVLERTVSDMPAPVPLVQENVAREDGRERVQRVVYFHTDLNPFAGVEEVREECAGDPLEKKRCRLYGVPHKQVQARFPRFSEKVHVYAGEELPAEGTWYHVVDPGGASGKPWAMVWAMADLYGRLWVDAEWPCTTTWIPNVGFPEPWAVPGEKPGHKFDGVPGGAADPLGLSILNYKEVCAAQEGWADHPGAAADGRVLGWASSDAAMGWREVNGADGRPRVRWMDSRFGATGTATASANTTLLEECAKAKFFFQPTPGDRIDEGAEALNARLAHADGWTPEAGDPADGPRIFFNARCTNTVFALRKWTGADGKKGATKDFIDLLRYLCTAQGTVHVAGMAGGGSGRARLPAGARNAVPAGRPCGGSGRSKWRAKQTGRVR